MLRERQYILRVVNVALDLALVAAAVVAAHGARQLLAMYVAPQLQPARLVNYYWLMGVAPLLIVGALGYYGFYESVGGRARTRAVAGRIALACFVTTLLLVAIDFFFGPQLRSGGTARTSAGVIVLFPAACFAILTIKAALLRRWLERRRRRGKDFRRVVLVGSGPPLEHFVRAARENPLWGMDLVGIVTDRPDFQEDAFDAEGPPEKGLGLPILADLSRAPGVLWRMPVDEVVLAPDSAPLSHLRPLMEICEEMGVRTHLTLNFFQGEISRPLVDRFEEIPVLSYWPTRPIGLALVFKYAFDRVAGTLGVLALAIPMGVVALAVKLTSKKGEPVFFAQTRCGLNGRLFTMWKFRTMHADAESRRKDLEAFNEQEGPVFKMADDPRITKLGRWLRKFSIDELPQLWNVMRGEMSLVGPRPPLPAEIEKYDRWQRRRLSMKPGITCIWQVRGRNNLPFETWMKMDLEYIDQWSLMLDFKILCRTVYVVATGYGAM